MGRVTEWDYEDANFVGQSLPQNDISGHHARRIASRFRINNCGGCCSGERWSVSVIQSMSLIRLCWHLGQCQVRRNHSTDLFVSSES